MTFHASLSGIIPARAGFTYDEVAPVGAGVGSSPLARGLPLGLGAAPARGRIIPARAGFTANTLITRSRTKDHPRSRGVYCLEHAPRSTLAGSSPLARGLPKGRMPPRFLGRIIPARAGFTPGCGRPPPGGPDHPRSRGVYLVVRIACAPSMGSSPLARGLRRPRGAHPPRVGIIPARAGFTPGPADPRSRTWDHPRSRGVYDAHVARHHECQGSSPLARGLPAGRGPGG